MARRGTGPRPTGGSLKGNKGCQTREKSTLSIKFRKPGRPEPVSSSLTFLQTVLYFAQQIGAGFIGLTRSRIYRIYTISKMRVMMLVNVFLILTILNIVKILLIS